MGLTRCHRTHRGRACLHAAHWQPTITDLTESRILQSRSTSYLPPNTSPLTRSWKSTVAPFSRSFSSISMCPSREARCSAVRRNCPQRDCQARVPYPIKKRGLGLAKTRCPCVLCSASSSPEPRPRTPASSLLLCSQPCPCAADAAGTPAGQGSSTLICRDACVPGSY